MKRLFHSAFTVATLALAAGPAFAGSPSETLEQGIYSEETKRDLPGAVQLFQQVISEAKANQALAAQAQYHLGVCYYKQQDFTNAKAAFALLSKDYPEEKELVALADKYLAETGALLPAPWRDGEETRLDLKLPGGYKIGFADYTIDAGENSGRKIWRAGSHIVAGETRSFSWSEAEAESFKPIRSRWMHSLLGDVEAVYASDHVDLKTAGKDEIKTVELNAPTLDNEEFIQWMRRLPLAAGYSITQLAMPSLMGGRCIPVKIDVTGPEKVVVPAGTFECYKLALSIKQTFWYSADANHYLVKFESGGAAAELSRISHRLPGAPVTFEDAALNVSFTAPAGWTLDRDGVQNGKLSVSILDPVAAGWGTLTVKPAALLEEADKTNLRALANYGLKFRRQTHEGFVTREESWKERVIHGQPAIGVVSDFDAGADKVTLYSVFVLGATNAASFDFAAASKDFEALRPQFDSVIDTFKSQ